MKRMKMKKNLKYIILGTINLIIIMNLPSILKNATTLNKYRYNWLIIALIILGNAISIIKIENKGE